MKIVIQMEDWYEKSKTIFKEVADCHTGVAVSELSKVLVKPSSSPRRMRAKYTHHTNCVCTQGISPCREQYRQ